MLQILTYIDKSKNQKPHTLSVQYIKIILKLIFLFNYCDEYLDNIIFT